MEIENKTYVRSEKARLNMSLSHRGKKFSDKTKRKMSESHKKLPFTEKKREQLRQASITAAKNNKGRPLPLEQRLKISKSNMGKKPTEETRQKLLGHHKGEKCTFWKGGITPIVKAIRTLTEYKVWRMGVFQRDNFTCQICNVRGGILQADHHPEPLCKAMERLNIKSKEDAIACAELWDISSGRTLCKECHKSTETYGRNRWQIISFTCKDIIPIRTKNR